jgi:phosphoribosylformimino-5-aminoimidazole carboxamide ribotide isomerase
MKVIPVLDILDGKVVHGIQGKRESYKPIVSQIVKTADPIEVVQVFEQKFGFTRFYVADLNAIQKKGNNYEVLRGLKKSFPHLFFIVDFGVRNLSDILSAGKDLVDIFILGTETIESLAELDKILKYMSSQKIIISLDLKNGHLLHVPRGFEENISNFLQIFMAKKIAEILVIDLARVGSNAGPIYPEARQIRLKYHGNVILGGGVRNASDLELLQKEGYNGVLIATALYAGKLLPQEIAPHV